MRKDKVVTIVDGGEERKFRIRQMPATKMERWINRFVFLVSKSKTTANALGALQERWSISGLTAEDLISVLSGLDYEEVEPLYNELMECCEYIPDKGNLNFSTPLDGTTADSVISDVMTLYKLKIEAVGLNFDFFQAGSPSPDGAGTVQPEIKFTKATRTSRKERGQ